MKGIYLYFILVAIAVLLIVYYRCKKKAKMVSFLIGSGFSIPEGLPGVSEINRRMARIDESEIMIHTDMHAGFLNGQVDENPLVRKSERLFIQEFLKFYNNDILKGKDFHYETFYDFYTGYLNADENSVEIEKFCDDFNSSFISNKSHQIDPYNSITRFDRTFNQLIAELLQSEKYFSDISTTGHPPYDEFVDLIAKIALNTSVKLHSLNHDLFLDWLGKKHSRLFQDFSDGYELAGSNYYGLVETDYQGVKGGRIHKNYYAKLERFANNFDGKIAFYKLHGSILNTIVFAPNGDKIGRIKSNYAVQRYFEEVSTNGKFSMNHLWAEVSPSFLSGTTNKTRYYSDDPYYKILFQHFENNLTNSGLLIIIGYGFKDEGINEIIIKHYSDKNRIIVIDPYPNIPATLSKYSIDLIKKSISDLNGSDIANIIHLLK